MMKVEAARVLAVQAHQGHLDRYGRPYIDHPLRVAQHPSLQGDELLVAAGLLHDTVEHGRVTWQEVRDAGADAELLGLLDAITKRPTEHEADYLLRVARHPRAVMLKRVDLLDKLSEPYAQGLSAGEIDALHATVVRRLATMLEVLLCRC
jgi:(p)ppGpp synthase/HD superfamily hydrolase